jgi:hypothetical protein
MKKVSDTILVGSQKVGSLNEISFITRERKSHSHADRCLVGAGPLGYPRLGKLLVRLRSQFQFGTALIMIKDGCLSQTQHSSGDTTSVIEGLTSLISPFLKLQVTSHLRS